MTQKSNFLTILSIVHGRILVEKEEILSVINLMSGKKFTGEQIVAGMNLCRPTLEQTFPLLADIDAKKALDELDKMLEENGNFCSNTVIILWLKKQKICNPADSFEVPRIQESESESGYETFLSKKRNLSF